VSVDFSSILGRLKPLFLGFWRRGLKPRFYEGILREQVRKVRNEVLDYSQMIERINCCKLGGIGYKSRAG